MVLPVIAAGVAWCGADCRILILQRAISGCLLFYVKASAVLLLRPLQPVLLERIKGFHLLRNYSFRLLYIFLFTIEIVRAGTECPPPVQRTQCHADKSVGEE